MGVQELLKMCAGAELACVYLPFELSQASRTLQRATAVEQVDLILNLETPSCVWAQRCVVWKLRVEIGF